MPSIWKLSCSGQEFDNFFDVVLLCQMAVDYPSERKGLYLIEPVQIQALALTFVLLDLFSVVLAVAWQNRSTWHSLLTEEIKLRGVCAIQCLYEVNLEARIVISKEHIT